MSKLQASYEFRDAPREVLVGDELVLEIECIGEVSPLDWIGIYPANVPTMPGLSHGNKYNDILKR